MQPKAFLSADTSYQSAHLLPSGPSGTIPRIPHRARAPNPALRGPEPVCPPETILMGFIRA